MKYDEASSAANAASEPPSTDASLQVSLGARFNFTVPQEFIINSESEGDESSTSKIVASASPDSPLTIFQDKFRQLLENWYGHLSAEDLFGRPSEEEKNDTVLLSVFQQSLQKCNQLGNFEKFFRDQFQDPEDKTLLAELQGSFAELYEELKGNTSADQFSRLIMDEVTVYCFYLIDSRTRNMQVFEQFEQDMHKKFTSYEFLSQPVSEYANDVSSLLAKIDRLGENYAKCSRSAAECIPCPNGCSAEVKRQHMKHHLEQECVGGDADTKAETVGNKTVGNKMAYTRKKKKLYGEQKKFYKQFLKHKWIPEASNVLKCLNSGSNHYSYMHEHIRRLRTLLSPLQQHYSVSKNNRVFTVKMVAGTISGALFALTESDICLESGDEIRLCADTVLYMDRDIEGEDFSGVNIACIAPKLECKGREKFRVRTDGKQLDNFQQKVAHAAESGKPGTARDKAGTTGSDGENGRYGHAGGHILLVAQSLNHDDLDLSANGSSGENGQDGGNGGPGWTPLKVGEDGKSPVFSNWLKSNDAVIISYGTFGEDGGPGGDAGMGGAVGKSGISGKIELFDLQNEDNCMRKQAKIEDGKRGSPGKPGKGGKHTRHGMDLGAFAEISFWGGVGSFFTASHLTGIDHREITDIRGGLTHDRIEAHLGSGEQYEVQCSGLPHQRKREDHPDYRTSGRGQHREGKSMQVKVNTSLANENQAIDKQACFQSMYQQCQQYLQHWNAGSHNKFLGSFAQKIGEGCQVHSFVALTHSEKMKASSAIWIARIQKQSEAVQSSVVQYTRQTAQAQVFTVKDFSEEDTKYDDVGYLGSEGHQNPLTLDLSLLKVVAERLKIPLSGITLESLLLTDEHDEAVEQLAKLANKGFVVVHCGFIKAMQHHAVSRDYLIVKDKQGNYFHLRHSINDTALVEALNQITLRENEPVAIERDDIFYPRMISWIQDEVGVGNCLTIPLTLEELHCVEQLKLIVTMRRTYHAIAGKYTQSPVSCQAFQKLYAWCLDGVLISKSVASLTSLQQYLVRDDLLILPLEISWIAGTFDTGHLRTSVDKYNRCPTIQDLLNVVTEVQKYHTTCMTEPRRRYVYLKHLSAETCLSGLQMFRNQLCSALRIFCDRDQISDEFQKVLSMASCETALLKVIPSGIDCEAGKQICQEAVREICKHRPSVYTVIDQFLDGIVECMQSLLKTDLYKLEELPPALPLDNLTFEEAYVAFQTLPSVGAVLLALTAYAKQHRTTNLPVPPANLLQHLLAYVYDIIRASLDGFHPQTPLDKFVQQMSETLAPENLYKTIQQAAKYVPKKDPAYSNIMTLLHLVEKFCLLTTLGAIGGGSDGSQNPVASTHLLDPKALLIRVPKLLLVIDKSCKKLDHCTIDDVEQYEKEVSARNKTVSDHANTVAAIHKTLLHYPMACPLSALHEWKYKMEKISLSVDRKAKKFQESDDNFGSEGDNEVFNDDICEQLKKLKSVLEHTIAGCTFLAKLRNRLRWTNLVKDLEQYYAIHRASHDGGSKEIAKLLAKHTLGLDQRFHHSPCVDSLNTWLGLGSAEQVPKRITVVTERSKPEHDVFIRAQEPNEDLKIVRPTLIFFPDKANHDNWHLCVRDPGDSAGSPQFSDVADDLVAAILGRDIREKLKEEASVDISEEQKAQLLAKLGYEGEFTIRHRVLFHDQVLIDEVNISFSLVAVSTKTGKVIAHRGTKIKSADIDAIDESFVVIVQSQCSPEATKAIKGLKILHPSSQQLSSAMDGAAAVCLVKNPGKQVSVHTVSKCGDVVEHNYCYTMPLITDLCQDGEKPYSARFLPLTDLLNGYHHFYQSLLLVDTLDSAIQATSKQYQSFYQSDVPEVVRAVRCCFIQETIRTTIQGNESENVQIMKQSVEGMLKPSHDRPPIFQEMYLTGLESFIYFLLGSKAASTKKEPFNIHYRFWQRVLEGELTLTPGKIECLCSAFAYLGGPERVDEGLHSQSASVRFSKYCSIANGLSLLEPYQRAVFPKKEDASLITRLRQQISSYQELHALEALQEASLDLHEDGKNLGPLLGMIQSVVPLREQLSQHLKDTPLLNREARALLLQNCHFYDNVYEMVLSWCVEKQRQLISNIQSIISDPLFAQDMHREDVMVTISSWLLARTEIALAEHSWKDLDDLYQIGELLLTLLTDMLAATREQCYTSMFQYSELPLSNLLTLVQVIDASCDISSVAEVMRMTSCDQWLKHLLVYNFLSVCAEHFDATSIDEIRNKMLCIDSKLLQILYNVFIDDQFEESEVKGVESTIGFLTEVQLHRILDWLPFINPCPDTYSTLCETAISMWEKKMAEIHFKQYLDHWHGLTEADKKCITFLMNRVRLSAEMSHSNFMSLLFRIRNKYIRSVSQESGPLFSVFEDLYYKRFTLQQADDIIQGHKYEEWGEHFNKLKVPKHEHYQSRNVEEVLDLIDMQIQSHAYQKSAKEFELIRTEALKISNQLSDFDVEKKSVLLHATFFQALQRHVTIDEKLQWLRENRVEFIVHLIKVWMEVTSQTPYSTQLVSLLLFLHTDDQGLLQQVKTGEGKTMVVGMLAAAKALLGYHVDVVSSNRDLAKDGVRKCQDYFGALDLKASANCTDDNDTNQQAYKSHIVYGDVGSFQRDVLTEETVPGGTDFSIRYSDLKKNCLLVDEVDSMFLDKGRHMLYISHESPALKHLESLFIMIWSSVLSIKPDDGEDGKLFIDALLDQMAVDLNTLVQNKTISVPEYLIEFCCRKMRAWVRSAYQARFMEADDQFVIDHRDEEVDHSQSKQIFPVDKQTGIEEYNMKWSNGLSQFLELKYRRALSTESLKAIFISNKRFFKRYGKALYGLTGTLGSTSSRQLLKEVYTISTVEIPTNREKRYTQRKARVATDSKEWCGEIYKEIEECCVEQPILVIFENIKQLNCLKAHLMAQDDISAFKIIEYARDGDNVEEKFEGDGSRVILATNKGGRGTDIKINERETPKGLHVIVTFLPENSRIEEQAFGRAARAGQAGSGCLVLQIDSNEYQSEIEVFGTTAAAAETFIEIEKVKREKAESDRINQLLSEGIPQLDLEENLYVLFQNHMRAFEATLNGATLLGEEIGREARKACVAVKTDQWAYWLDSVRDKIRAVDSPEKRQQLMSEFNEKFPCQDLPPPSSSPDSMLFAKPEHSIQLGQAYMKEEKYSPALTCFERAIATGDLTGLAAMTACYCYVKTDPEASKEKKKRVRRYLKKAKSQMDALRQSWMANGEVGKSLGDLLDVSQYVDGEVNHYERQIEEKLKVIGLHLNTLGILLGCTLDETSFINKSDLKKNTLTDGDSKKVYRKLVDEGIICHHKVRSRWKKRKMLEPLLREMVEPQIADDLISLILNSATITEADLYPLVYSSDGLGVLLAPAMQPAGALLYVSQVDAKLPDGSLKQSWEALKEKFSDSLGGGTAQLTLHPDDPIFQTLQKEDYEGLSTHLKSSSLYQVRALLSCDQMTKLELGRYEKCKIKDEEGTSEQSLRDFLTSLFAYCHDHKEGYCYEYMLPFDCQTAEAKKLHTFLLEQDILKSGSLAGDCDSEDDLKSKVEGALGEEYSKEQLAFILNVVQGLYGEVRGFEDGSIMKIGFTDFYDLKGRPQDVPEALDFFTTWHLDYFLALEADRGWWDWNAFAVAMIGLAQVIAGALLVTLTVGIAASIGSGLIAEGINDMVYATMAGITGTFSWKDWAIQKAISMAISIATGGINILAGCAKTVTKVASASRFCTFAKVLGKAAWTFAVNLTANIFSDILLAEVQERVVTCIVQMIEDHLFSKILESLRSKLVLMSKQAANDDLFDTQCQDLKRNFEQSLQSDIHLPSAFDALRSKVVTSLKKNYDDIATNLSKSESGWAKLVGNGAKAALLADKVYTAVDAGLSTIHAVSAIVKIIDIDENSSAENVRSEVNDALVERELDQIKEVFRAHIHQQLKKKLKEVLENIIKGSLKRIAKAGKNLVASKVTKALNGKTTSELVKDLREKKQQATVLSDAEDQSGKKKSATSEEEKKKPPKPTTRAARIQRRKKLQDTILKPRRKATGENEVLEVKHALQLLKEERDNSHDGGLEGKKIPQTVADGEPKAGKLRSSYHGTKSKANAVKLPNAEANLCHFERPGQQFYSRLNNPFFRVGLAPSEGSVLEDNGENLGRVPYASFNSCSKRMYGGVQCPNIKASRQFNFNTAEAFFQPKQSQPLPFVCTPEAWGKRALLPTMEKTTVLTVDSALAQDSTVQ